MNLSKLDSIRRGVTRSQDPKQAARELHAALYQEQATLGVFYCSPEYPLDALASALHHEFGDFPLIGCTTAGEITPEGYLEGSLTGVSFAAPDFVASTHRLEGLSRFDVFQAKDAAADLRADLVAQGLPVRADNTFGYLLIDGLSMREELVASALHRGLGGLPLFGGSAGDGVRMKNTYLYHQGRFHQNVALATLLYTSRPFRLFRTHQFTPTEHKLVVTGALPSKRLVTELNGLPAAKEFARVIGVTVDDLHPLFCSDVPVLVKAGGSYYVRSISEVHPDHSLGFLCAIDEGIVLTLGKHAPMLEGMEATFASIRSEIGEPSLVLASDCLLRHLELKRLGQRDQVGAFLQRQHAVGFSTYGEQFHSMHVNQTLTGVAIG